MPPQLDRAEVRKMDLLSKATFRIVLLVRISIRKG